MKYIVKEHRYRESRNGKPIRIRKMTQFVGFAPNEQVGCFSTSADNMRLAILGRVLSKEVNGVRKPLLKTLPDPGHESPLVEYANAISKLVPPTTSLDPFAFATQYSGGKRKIYEKAAASLSLTPLDKADAEIALFLKFEKDVRSQKPKRIPRCILPPVTPRYTVETGRFVHPVEKKIYAAIDELWGSAVVTKGKNYKQVAEMISSAWSDFIEPCSLDCDVSKMDQSITEEVLEVLLDMIADLNADDSEYLRKILKWTLRTKVRGRADDGMFSYRQRGTLSSGMTYTSITGVFVVTGVMFMFAKEHGLRLRMIDAGDDLTIVFESNDLPIVKQELGNYYARFGLTLEIGKPNFVFEQIEFCQSRPVLINSQYQMVRNARSAAVKDYVCADDLKTTTQICAWWEAVGKCGIASQGGAPIATSRYNQLIRSSLRVMATLNLSPRMVKRHRANVRRYEQRIGGWNNFGDGMTNHNVVDPSSRYSYFLAFGITPQVQRAIEESLDSEDLTPFRTDMQRYDDTWDVCEGM